MHVSELTPIADTVKSSIPCQACLARHIGLHRIAWGLTALCGAKGFQTWLKVLHGPQLD